MARKPNCAAFTLREGSAAADMAFSEVGGATAEEEKDTDLIGREEDDYCSTDTGAARIM
jgi:hypothetical protein